MAQAILRPIHHPGLRGLMAALALSLGALGSAQAYGPDAGARPYTAPGHTAQGRWAPALALPEFDARQAQQQQRIAQGVARGHLDRREAHRLRAQQRDIARAAHQARRDGVLTAHERRHLAQLQQQAGQNIRLALRGDHRRDGVHPVRGYR